jgi:cellulose synthase/poly-beta-1,6-N-acetylglucosamine synthase-like glycosyltransferase
MEMLLSVLKLVLGVTGAVCLYTYIGYPLVVGLLSRLLGRTTMTGEAVPTISLLVAAYNEAAVIREKLENSLSLDYPREKLQVIVISDGSDDGTDDIVQGYASQGIEFRRVEPRSGKPVAMNCAAEMACGEVLLLSDANTMLSRDAARIMVRHFADPHVGAVTGDVRLRSEMVAHGQGEGLFYRLERFIQRCESNLWAAVGVDGGMYALRRTLFVPNRRDTLIDDFVTAMNVARTGARVIYEPRAVAWEDAVEDPAQEFRRRVRTVAGGFQALFGRRGLPRWKQPWLWLAFLSHKVFRWIGPFVLLTLLVANAGIVLMQALTGWAEPLYGASLGLQVGCYLLAVVAPLWGRRRPPGFVSVPYYFCLANSAALAGFFRWLRGRQPVTWARADRTLLVRSQSDR